MRNIHDAADREPLPVDFTAGQLAHYRQEGLLDHKRKSEDSWHLAVPVEGDGIPAILKAGEAVAFTGLTLHRSKLNHTQTPRRAFFMEYAAAFAKYSRNGEPGRPVVDNSNTWIVSGAAPLPLDY